MGFRLGAPAETRWPLAPLGSVASSGGHLSGSAHSPSLRRDSSAASRPRSGPTPALAFPCPARPKRQRLVRSAWSYPVSRLSLGRLCVSMLSFSRAGSLAAFFLSLLGLRPVLGAWPRPRG